MEQKTVIRHSLVRVHQTGWEVVYMNDVTSSEETPSEEMPSEEMPSEEMLSSCELFS